MRKSLLTPGDDICNCGYETETQYCSCMRKKRALCESRLQCTMCDGGKHKLVNKKDNDLIKE